MRRDNHGQEMAAAQYHLLSLQAEKKQGVFSKEQEKIQRIQ